MIIFLAATFAFWSGMMFGCYVIPVISKAWTREIARDVEMELKKTK